MHPLEQLRDDALARDRRGRGRAVARSRARAIISDAAAAFPHGASK